MPSMSWTRHHLINKIDSCMNPACLSAALLIRYWPSWFSGLVGSFCRSLAAWASMEEVAVPKKLKKKTHFGEGHVKLIILIGWPLEYIVSYSSSIYNLKDVYI